MARSMFYRIEIAVLALLCCELTVCQGDRVCRVVSLPIGNKTIIKFDFIWSSQQDGNSAIYESSTFVTGMFRLEQNVTNTVEVTIPEVKSTEATPKVASKHQRRARSISEWGSHCNCQIQSGVPFMIKILKVWSQSGSYNLTLQLNSSNGGLTAIPVTESVRETLNTTSVIAEITGNETGAFYDVVLEVSGNTNSVTCAMSADASLGPQFCDKREETIKANSELIFEAPLLIFGAVLAVVGFLLFVTGIAVWRSYRKQRKRLTQTAKFQRERDERPQSNYEMITYDTEIDFKPSSTPEDNLPRKLSVISGSVSEQQRHKESISSTSHSSPTLQTPAPVRTLPVPDKIKQKKLSFISVRKKKDKIKNIQQANDNDKDSDEQQTYEVVSEEPQRPLTQRDNRVATPLVLLLNPGTQQPVLRKTDHRNQINAMNASSLKAGLQQQGGLYSHLDGSRCENGDLSPSHNNTGSGQRTSGRHSTDVNDINRDFIDKPNTMADIITDAGRMTLPIDSNEEEQDHIYEGFGESEDNKEHKKNETPTNTAGFTREPKIAHCSPVSNEHATSSIKCEPEHKKTATIQPDQSDKSHSDDNAQTANAVRQNTETETIMHKEHAENNVESTANRSSLADNKQPAERSATTLRASVGRLPPNLMETQEDTAVDKTTTSGSQECTNTETNDNTHIIEIDDNIQTNETNDNIQVAGAATTPKDIKLNPNDTSIESVTTPKNTGRQFSGSDTSSKNEHLGNQKVADNAIQPCNPPATSPAATLNGGVASVEGVQKNADDGLEGYTIIDNILYETL